MLDVAGGAPVEGVRVSLERDGSAAASGATGPDGRLRLEAELQPGLYTLRFDLRGRQSEPHLFDQVAFLVRLDEQRHYHVPLLISPFGASAYRGS